jgi:hypothetical protein
MTLRISIQDESCNKSSRGFVSHEAPRPEPELISHELISHAYLVLCFPSSFNPSLHLFPNLPINLLFTQPVTGVPFKRYSKALVLTALEVDPAEDGKNSSRTPPIHHRCGEGRPGDTR